MKYTAPFKATAVRTGFVELEKFVKERYQEMDQHADESLACAHAAEAYGVVLKFLAKRKPAWKGRR